MSLRILALPFTPIPTSCWCRTCLLCAEQECVDALIRLNVGVPKKFIEHLVNVADSDRDGEINHAEFSRILTCDDITKFKAEGSDQGIVKIQVSWPPSPGLIPTPLAVHQAPKP